MKEYVVYILDNLFKIYKYEIVYYNILYIKIIYKIKLKFIVVKLYMYNFFLNDWMDI